MRSFVIIITVLGLFIHVRLWVLSHISIIESVSMQPTLLSGDIVFCETLHKRILREGDIVCFKVSQEESTILVKRVHHLRRDPNGNMMMDLRGDNASNSCDSRSFGYVPVKNVINKPRMIICSWDEERHCFRAFRFMRKID